MSARPRKRNGQLGLPLPQPRTWGGARRGAGRKPKGVQAEVRHASRPPLDRRHPVHITYRVVRSTRHLRGFRTYPAIRTALCAARDRLGARIIHYSIQRDHLHLLVEAEDQVALGRAMKGFAVRVARRLNRLAGRRGRVIADRYHARYLRTPTEVRRALVYVLQNATHHARGAERRLRANRDWFDPMSSAAYFDGWNESCRRALPRCDVPGHPLHGEPDTGMPVAAPRTWLLKCGWQRAGGLLDSSEVARTS